MRRLGRFQRFGSRTGDAFTKITITIAAIWVLLIMIQVWVVKADAKNTEALRHGSGADDRSAQVSGCQFTHRTSNRPCLASD